jgi:hypothetical protein
MKPIYAIIVFLFLVGASVLSSLHSYRCAEENIVSDMNRALALTLAEKQDGWITPDTIHVYRSHLQMPALRDKSFLTYALDDRSGALKSRAMRGHGKLSPLKFQGYANCSVASVWLMSDQRLPFVFSLLATLWMVFILLRWRKERVPEGFFGGIMLSEDGRGFVTVRQESIPFTPMQQQLMEMFFTSPDHRLSKQQICDALWPKKPDASDTLYTLVRRLKRVLEQQTGLQIVCERGKNYLLKEGK